MSSAGPVNGTAPTHSKSAKKRKAKTPAAAAPSSTTDGSVTPAVDSNQEHNASAASGADYESPYLKELQKNLRNANKKLSSSAKADAIVAENPNKSLDELVELKKLNNDQKAQMVKKPALQEQIKTLDEQIKQYKQFGKDHEERYEREKATIQEAHRQEIAKVKRDAADEAITKASDQQQADLLTLTQFLHAASSKRNDDTTPELEGRAFEGVLLKIYQGSSEATAGMKNLVLGADVNVSSVEGEELDFTFAQVKQLSNDTARSFEDPETRVEEPGTAAEDNQPPPASDPTIANAGLTEMDDTVTFSTEPNGIAEPALDDTPSAVPEQASIGADTGNAVAESSWDPTASAQDSWVEVERAEPEDGPAKSTATQNTNSWAEEVTEGAAADAKAAAENDGFEQVVHHHTRGGRGRGGGRGEFRGRGRGGEGYRGRGRGGGEGGERRGGGRGRGRGGEGQSRGGRGGRGRDGQGGGRPAETAGTDSAW